MFNHSQQTLITSTIKILGNVCTHMWLYTGDAQLQNTLKNSYGDLQNGLLLQRGQWEPLSTSNGNSGDWLEQNPNNMQGST